MHAQSYAYAIRMLQWKKVLLVHIGAMTRDWCRKAGDGLHSADDNAIVLFLSDANGYSIKLGAWKNGDDSDVYEEIKGMLPDLDYASLYDVSGGNIGQSKVKAVQIVAHAVSDKGTS